MVETMKVTLHMTLTQNVVVQKERLIIALFSLCNI